jgi:hypothetical protein
MFNFGELKMFKKLLAISSLILAALVSSSAFATTEYDFDLVNNSKTVIKGFETKEEGKWSDNWLDGTVKPGETFHMHWGSGDGHCVVPFRVKWADGHPADEMSVDWCKQKPKKITMSDKSYTVK